MSVPHRKQKIQDRITQQWVILFGKKINTKEDNWLLGPFAETNAIGLKLVHQLAEKEQLIIESRENAGLLQSTHQLNLSESELKRLSKSVIDFYEHTADYKFDIEIKWNPLFKIFGILLKKIFSNRIEQLNVPIKNTKHALKSEIIYLSDAKNQKVKRTVWLRTVEKTGQVVYSGVYETCTIPSGQNCIKAIFPLPNGNATVILSPSVGSDGELILQSSGKKMGDSGFYFLLNDSNGGVWAKHIKSFKDRLIVTYKNERIIAVQTLTLWGFKVLRFTYNMEKQNARIP